ncbi:MAG: outer membrane lipoprotein-sorting protein, partial [Firmicutes bacterium]|nr:outer membrane lipoprotein-sorting protein [Bacillota bacterium]
MKKLFRILACLILITFMASPMASAMTAEEIIQKRDSNEYVKTAIAESKMVIVSGKREMTKTMITYAKDDHALTVFTNPRDRGTKFLKRGDDLWMF